MDAALTLSEADVERVADRVVAKLRAEQTESAVVPELLTCEQFGKRIGRSTEWVQDRCRIRRIKTVAGRRPYRIPASELARMLA